MTLIEVIGAITEHPCVMHPHPERPGRVRADDLAAVLAADDALACWMMLFR